MAIISSAEPTNRYVGIAKRLPASRRPRRLPIVIRAIAATHELDPEVDRGPGTAEVTCSIADAVETATVIT